MDATGALAKRIEVMKLEVEAMKQMETVSDPIMVAGIVAALMHARDDLATMMDSNERQL